MAGGVLFYYFTFSKPTSHRWHLLYSYKAEHRRGILPRRLGLGLVLVQLEWPCFFDILINLSALDLGDFNTEECSCPVHSTNESAVSQACALHVTSFVRLYLSWSPPQFCGVSLSIPVFISDATDAKRAVTQEMSDRVGIRSKERTLSILSRNLSNIVFYPVEVLILKIFFLMWTIFWEVFIQFVIMSLLFWFFGREAREILAVLIGPAPPVLEGEVLTTGPPGKSRSFNFKCDMYSSAKGSLGNCQTPRTVHTVFKSGS